MPAAAQQVSVIRDITLPSIDPSGVATTADIYHSADGQPRPLIIVLPGAFGQKEWYSGFASTLAAAGDGVVLVAAHMVTMGGYVTCKTAAHVCM